MKNFKEIVLHLASIPGIQVLVFLITFLSLYFGTAFMVSTILPIFGVVMFPYDCGLGIGLFSAFMAMSIMGTVPLLVFLVISIKQKSGSWTLFCFGMCMLVASPIIGAVVSIPLGWKAGGDTFGIIGGLGLFTAFLASMSIPKDK